MCEKIKNKKVSLNLLHIDGNAFSLMGAFSAQARKEGWDKSEIDEVINDCTSGDYDHLVSVLEDHCDGSTYNEEGNETYEYEMDEGTDED